MLHPAIAIIEEQWECVVLAPGYGSAQTALASAQRLRSLHPANLYGASATLDKAVEMKVKFHATASTDGLGYGEVGQGINLRTGPPTIGL